MTTNNMLEAQKTKRQAAINWLKLLLFLLDDAIILVLLVLLLRFLEVSIPLPVIVLGLVLISALMLVIHWFLLPDFRRRPLTGKEAMIGEIGVVTRPLRPTGTVTIGSECWNARCLDGTAASGETVVVTRVSGLLLLVTKK